MIYSIGDSVNVVRLHWVGDWNGYEVGYDDVLVVGHYYDPLSNQYYYIDMEEEKILEIFNDGEGEY